MISKLSARLTEKLLSNGAICEQDKDLYIYGLFMLISHLMFFIIACIFGLILGCVFESIIFYIAFQFIRRYAGGYHAKTEAICEIATTLSILACITVIRLSKMYDFQAVLLIISILSAVVILVLCPLDTPEKPLSENEFKYFRKISWLVLFVIMALIIVSYVLKWNVAFSACCMSLIFESVLISAGKIKRIKDDKK